MIYVMSNEEKSRQLGQLMLDRKESTEKWATLTLKATNVGKLFTDIGSGLKNDPAGLLFPGESVDSRFSGNYFSSGIPPAEEVRSLIDSIREEQLKIWDYELALKNLGF